MISEEEPLPVLNATNTTQASGREILPEPAVIVQRGSLAEMQDVKPILQIVMPSKTADWASNGQAIQATQPATTTQPVAVAAIPREQVVPIEQQGSFLRERRHSKATAPATARALNLYDRPWSSSSDDKDDIPYFSERPPSQRQSRGDPQPSTERHQTGLRYGSPFPSKSQEDVLTALPSDIGGSALASKGKDLDLKRLHHLSIKEPRGFSLGHSHRPAPIARDWSAAKKRWVALVACLNMTLLGLIVGIYAGEVPAIQYAIVDEHHYAILGNVVLFIGLAITTFVFWPLPLLHGRKPYTLAALAIFMPLQFPQAVAVDGSRTPYTPKYRVALLLSRAVAGLVMGFANINFIATLLDLFGASLQSINPHQEVVNVNDVRRHGGGMGAWLGIWTWSFIGSIGVGFFIGAIIISGLDVAWGFWITIILTAFVLLLNVLVPEVRRSPYRRSVAEVRTPTELSRRVARGEIKMHLYSTGPKWWYEEVIAGIVLSFRMLKQPGFLILSLYIGWIYGQIVMIIVVSKKSS